MTRSSPFPTPQFTRYVALGDSQTEGVGDPDSSGGLLGWADRLAQVLDRLHSGLNYANLAVCGRCANQIRAEQLAPALAMRPDLVSVVAGMNDLLRPRYDRDAVLADIESMFAAFAAIGAQVVTFTFPDIGAVAPLVRPLSGRVREMNIALRTVAARHRVTVIDFEPVPATTDRRVWTDDRLHLNPLGHELVSRAVADGLGLPGADDTWRTALPLDPNHPRPAVLSDELRWATRHLIPWVGRRIRGVSSGNRLGAKRPELLPVT